jgi:hypothetical protein
MTLVKLKIGTVMRSIISERRLTLKEISKGTGVPATNITEWTNNRAPKNPEQAQKVAVYLGVSLLSPVHRRHPEP